MHFYDKDFEWVWNTAMRTNIIDEGEKVKVLVTLPGVNKEDIDLSMKDGMLEVRVNDQANDGEKPKYLWQEFKPAGYDRKILVGSNVVEDSVDASFDNGILTILLDKKKPSTIHIH